MADIQIHCSQCGCDFVASEEEAGLLVHCPQCNKEQLVPVLASTAERAARLKVRRDTPVGGGKPCPSCGASMADDAILCVQCGFDIRRGTRLGQSSGLSRSARWLIAGVGLIIVAGAARFVFKPKSLAEKPVAPPPAAPAMAKPVAPPPPPVQIVTVAPPVEVTAPVEPAGPTPEELAQMEAERRLQLTEQLDQNQPLYRPGEEVELRKANGLILRGKFKAASETGISIVSEEGEVQVSFTEMDRASRVRCDTVFREKLIEYQVRKSMSSL